MLTVMIHAKIKPQLLDEFIELASLLTKETRGVREGCLAYAFNQRSDEPCEFVVYEQWESQQALDAHIEQIILLLGPPKEGELLPEKLMNCFESVTPVFYNQI
ncbi:antibiotic biosynthesis monooxygenase [Vibrio sp. S4M6]|uniref:putative quinol monooxygenase n=1 Tax=Vibrio sinus TaxID=2946865 RepID=UPI002029CF09|nr:antibiotic biosynthesis monooxygenase [Vibrio sinus]MCL9781719.1 antibiotic biosynthesis monooxygenase [Vibrio sinus]